MQCGPIIGIVRMGRREMSEYIERKAAKRIVDDINTWSSGWRDYAKLQMDSIPAADVREVARGKWEEVEVTDVSAKTNLPLTAIASMRCSVCNRYHNEVYYYGDPTEIAHYCPNCGASMEVEHD